MLGNYENSKKNLPKAGASVEPTQVLRLGTYEIEHLISLVLVKSFSFGSKDQRYKIEGPDHNKGCHQL